MSNFTNFDDILEYAIKLENESYDFYSSLAKKDLGIAVTKVCNELAQEELTHRKKLEAIRDHKVTSFNPKPINDLKLTDLLKDVKEEESQDSLSYQKALTIAMKREKYTLELYKTLSTEISDQKIKELFEFLAGEEAKHKHRLEVEYDTVILKDN